MKYRATGFIVMGVLALAQVGLYLVKYGVQDVTQKVGETQAELKKERDSLHLLGAEWAYLNRPERLKQLSSRYLELQPVTSAQFVSFSNLPDAVPVVSVSAEVGEGNDAFYQPVSNEPLVQR